MCAHNAEVAAKAGKKDHLNCWQVCKLIADPVLNRSQTGDTNLMQFPWSKHPFCGSLIESYIDYYLSVLDIQMAAMLACCFASACANCKRFACSGKDCQKISQINNNEPEKRVKQTSLPMKNSVSDVLNESDLNRDERELAILLLWRHRHRIDFEFDAN